MQETCKTEEVDPSSSARSVAKAKSTSSPTQLSPWHVPESSASAKTASSSTSSQLLMKRTVVTELWVYCVELYISFSTASCHGNHHRHIRLASVASELLGKIVTGSNFLHLIPPSRYRLRSFFLRLWAWGTNRSLNVAYLLLFGLISILLSFCILTLTSLQS